MDATEKLKKAEEKQTLLSSSITIGSPSASSTALKPRGTFGSHHDPDVSIFVPQSLPHISEHHRLAEMPPKPCQLEIRLTQRAQRYIQKPTSVTVRTRSQIDVTHYVYELTVKCHTHIWADTHLN